jgi:hypothetical protein
MASAVLPLALMVVLTSGCGSGIVLGPAPTDTRPENQALVDGMRSCVESLSASDAKTLKDTGQVEMTYAQLKASDPTNAAVIDKWVADTNATHASRPVPAVDSRGNALSPEIQAKLAEMQRPQVPASVKFYRESDGSIWWLAQYESGSTSNVQLSKAE